MLAGVLVYIRDGDNGGDGNSGGRGGGESEERITFASDEGIFTVDLGGDGEPVRVEGTEPGDESPDWTRDGERLAFSRDGRIPSPARTSP